MKPYAFTLPDNFLECLERYHVCHNPENNRPFDDTVSILLNYALGRTCKIPSQETKIIEDFFEQKEDTLSALLDWVLASGHNPDNFY